MAEQGGGIRLLLPYLRQLAIENAPMPSNKEIAEAIGWGNKSGSLSTAIYTLARKGHFQIIKHNQRARQIVFPDGHETLCPHEAISDVVWKAAHIFGVNLSGLVGPSRERHYIIPRFAAIKTARDLGYSTLLVGKVLARDHSSIVYAENQIDVYLRYYPETVKPYQELRKACGVPIQAA